MREREPSELEWLTLKQIHYLTFNGEPYGAAINHALETRAGRKLSVGASHVVLRRLEQKGFVTSAFGEATAMRGGRRKRLYTITAPGMRAMTAYDARMRAALGDATEVLA